jgi:diamine N-acetyltransferase
VSLFIRAARPDDAALIFALIRELAEYEKLSHEVDANEVQIAETLFAQSPKVFCDIAEWNGAPAGFALWFLNFSTFRGRYSLYLEDIFVRPAFRRRGIGKALLARLARQCAANGYTRFEWSVLDWNAPAIAFYKSIGAQVMDEWRICRVSGRALQNLASQSKSTT